MMETMELLDKLIPLMKDAGEGTFWLILFAIGKGYVNILVWAIGLGFIATLLARCVKYLSLNEDRNRRAEALGRALVMINNGDPDYLHETEDARKLLAEFAQWKASKKGE